MGVQTFPLLQLHETVTSKLSPRHVCREMDTTRIPFVKLSQIESQTMRTIEIHTKNSHLYFFLRLDFSTIGHLKRAFP